MAKISRYQVDSVPSLGDMVIGTDTSPGENLRTKNYTWQQVASMLAQDNALGVADQVVYTFQSDISTQPLQLGSMSIPGGGLDTFANLSTITVSKRVRGNKDITQYFPLFLNKEIIIAISGDLNSYGVYNVTSIQDNALNAAFWDVQLQHKASNGVMYPDSIMIFGEFTTGAAAADKNYVHRQDTPSNLWTVNHNLNKFPSATLVLSTGQTGYGDVQYIDENNLTITLANPESGKAYIN